jgi:hypothetical protein
MSEFTQAIECCICFETIGQKNNCVTPCGHAFCFNCLTKSLTHNNSCPCCRAVLVEVPEEDIDESDDEDEDDDEDYEHEEEEDDDGNVDVITERFLKAGYTAVDIMSLLTGRYKRSDPKYTDEYINKMVEVFDNICEDIDNESEEQSLFAGEDHRIYPAEECN